MANEPSLTGESSSSKQHKRGVSNATTLPNPSPEMERGKRTTNLEEKDLFDEPFDKQAILSLDGGGVRGLSILIILKHLMEEIAHIEKELDAKANHCTSECPSVKRTYSSYFPEPFVCKLHKETNLCVSCCRYLPCHYFDYIGGTSSGGLIAIMLGRLRMSVPDCITEFKALAGDVFSRRRYASLRGPIPWIQEKYSSNKLQQAVERVVKHRTSEWQRDMGAVTFNSPPGLCKTLVLAYAELIDQDLNEYSEDTNSRWTASSESTSHYVFRSYDHWGFDPKTKRTFNLTQFEARNPGPAHSIPIWQVARATSAAPTYFESIKIGNREYIDGAYGRNNPVMELFKEALLMSGSDLENVKCIQLIISIGTGERQKPRILKKGRLKRAYYVMKDAIRKVSESEDSHEQMANAAKLWGFPYARFSVNQKYRLRNVKLDDVRPETLNEMERLTNEYCKEEKTKQELHDMAVKLVNHRRRRINSPLWPWVSSGTQYRCTVQYCPRQQKLLQKKEDLHEHLEKRHDLQDDKEKEDLEQEGMIKL